MALRFDDDLTTELNTIFFFLSQFIKKPKGLISASLNRKPRLNPGRLGPNSPSNSLFKDRKAGGMTFKHNVV